MVPEEISGQRQLTTNPQAVVRGYVRETKRFSLKRECDTIKYPPL